MPPPPEPPPEPQPPESKSVEDLPGESSSSGQSVYPPELRPGVFFPDAAKFKCQQLRAMLVVNVLTLAAVVAMWWIAKDHRVVVGVCAAIAATITAVGLVRYLLARAKVKAEER